MTETYKITSAHRFGYFIAILVNGALFFVMNNLHKWPIPFLTQDFKNVLWAINLALAAAAFINFVFLFFDPKWFRSLMHAIQSCFGLLSVYTFYRIFPLDLPNNMIAQWGRIGLLVVMGLTCLGILIELIQFFHGAIKLED